MNFQARGIAQATATQVARRPEGTMTKRMENRRNNLRRLIKDNGGPKVVAARLGKGASWISQMTGPHPTRPVSEDTARDIEAAFALPEGSLDWPAADAAPVVTAEPAARPITTRPAATGDAAARDAEIVSMLAAVWSEDKIELPVVKFGQIAAYAISEAAETGKPLTEAQLRRLIALLK